MIIHQPLSAVNSTFLKFYKIFLFGREKITKKQKKKFMNYWFINASIDLNIRRKSIVLWLVQKHIEMIFYVSFERKTVQNQFRISLIKSIWNGKNQIFSLTLPSKYLSQEHFSFFFVDFDKKSKEKIPPKGINYHSLYST